MLSIHSLLPQLRKSYPSINFQKGANFSWSPDENTVYYTILNDTHWMMLLHELAHALLGHAEYDKDIELIHMERQAWDRAVALASSYDSTISEDIIESQLDSYRDWLHSRSTCPQCEATGLQIKKQLYKCAACSHQWRVNEARTCGLKRYSIS